MPRHSAALADELSVPGPGLARGNALQLGGLLRIGRELDARIWATKMRGKGLVGALILPFTAEQHGNIEHGRHEDQ